VKKLNKHEKAVNDLLLHPSLIGIESVVFRARGSFWTPGKAGQITLETDILFFTDNVYEEPFHLVEYKSSDTNRQKAVEQLYKGREYIKRFFNTDAYLYFVYNYKKNLEIETFGKTRRKKC